MIATTTPTFIVLALACLVLNFYAFRSNTRAAGWGSTQKLRMAAIWVTIIVGLTLVVSWLG